MHLNIYVGLVKRVQLTKIRTQNNEKEKEKKTGININNKKNLLLCKIIPIQYIIIIYIVSSVLDFKICTIKSEYMLNICQSIDE